MATHDYVIANQGFPAFRSDLNNALAAIVSNNSSATEPTTMFAHMIWVDTAANPSVLKIRNADNDAWITIGTINQTGDTFTLTSAVSATTLNTSGAVVFNDAGADVDFRVEGDTDANLVFVDASTDRMGVGTSSPANKLQVAGNIGIGDGNFLGWGSLDTLIYGDSSSNFMYFRTNTAERVRIDSAGALLVGTTAMSPNSGKLKVEHPTANQNIATFRNTAASSPYGNVIGFTSASPDNNTNYFLLCGDSTANRTIIYSDGDVWTSDAGTLSSDQKLKNTITDASPKLDDVMRLRVRNFYWNEDYHPEKTDKKLIGFIAQEFEEVFPGLVTEHAIRGGDPIYEDQAVVDDEGNPVLDEDGNPKTEQVQVGETEKEYAKGIKEGKLIPILVKALQEAVERIETLEAKVAALENA